jgi:ribulose-phosphate 3-epimerase
VARAAAAGANVLVAGTALYRDPAGLDHAGAERRARAQAARAGDGTREAGTPEAAGRP